MVFFDVTFTRGPLALVNSHTGTSKRMRTVKILCGIASALSSKVDGIKEIELKNLHRDTRGRQLSVDPSEPFRKSSASYRSVLIVSEISDSHELIYVYSSIDLYSICTILEINSF